MEDGISREKVLIPLSTGMDVQSPDGRLQPVLGLRQVPGPVPGDRLSSVPSLQAGPSGSPRSGGQAWAERPEGPGSERVGREPEVAAGVRLICPTCPRPRAPAGPAAAEGCGLSPDAAALIPRQRLS